MKILSGPTTTAVRNPLGEEPILILKIQWAIPGDLWYADRDLTLNSAEGRILNAGDLAAQIKLDSIGTVGAMSFVLDDGDGVLKALMDANCVEGTRASIYQGFASALANSDLVLLMAGVLVAPTWSEGERKLSFEIETKVQDVEVGFALEQEYYDTLIVTTPLIADEAIGRAWPLCFGSVLHFPAVKLIAPPETSLNQTFKTGDPSFLVEDASRFPTDAPIDVIIDGMVFNVTVDKANNRMNVGEANVPKYSSVPFATRDAADADYANPWVAWIGQDVFLANTYIYFTSEFGNHVYHRVLRQEGRKIWLDNRIVQKKQGDARFNDGFGVEPQLLDAPTIINEVAQHGREGWGIEMSYVGGATASNGHATIASFRDTVKVISGVPWKFGAGESVRLWGYPSGSGQHPVTYVANLIPSTEVRSVYAWRTNPRTGQRLFRQIPTNYYTVNLADTSLAPFTILGGGPSFNPTSIKLKSSLKDLYAQGWEETIYVSLKSSVGPNAVDIISWLISTFSNLTTDSSSFTATQAALVKYPCSILYDQKGNVLQMAEDIAWKSRCALIIENGVARMKYLSAEPNADLNVDETMIEHRSINISATRNEDLVTSFRATWRKDYSGRPGKELTFVKLENISRFGLRKRTFDFNIYNIQSLVQKSASFWAHRMSNSWVYAKLNVLKRTSIALDLCDCVQLTTSHTGAVIKTIVETHSYDTSSEEQSTFGLSLWLPRVSGTTIQDPRAWLSDAGDVIPADPLDALGSTIISELWADDVSRSYVDHKVQSRLAKIVNESVDQLGFNVDIFDDGYEDVDGHDLPPTNRNLDGSRQEFVAYPIDLNASIDRNFPDDSGTPGLEKYRNILPAGTRIQIFRGLTGRWSFNVPSDRSHVAAKINGPPVDALGRMGVSTYPNGFSGAPGKTEVKAIHLGDVSSAAVGDRGLLLQHGAIKVFFPLGGSGTATRVFQITDVSAGDGSYTAQEYDFQLGTPIGDPVTIYENNQANAVPLDAWVDCTLRGDSKLWFNLPLACT